MIGRRFKDKATGRVIRITGKWRVAKYWTCTSDTGKKIYWVHEGTLKKFYDPVEGE